MNAIDIKSIIKAAKAGGEVLNKYFGTALEITQKTIVVDLVSKADIESENAIIEELHARFPHFNMIAEESGHNHKDSAYTFIIDPLDGTSNFLTGIPYFSVSVGLMKGNEIVAGVVYAPITGDVYHAVKGKGAYLNDTQIHVSAEKEITRSSIAYSHEYSEDHDKFLESMKALYRLKLKRLFRNISPALDMCLVASGRMEAFISNNISPHDFIAGKLIVEEAGGRISDFAGEVEKDPMSTRFIVSNNTAIHRHIVEMAHGL